MSDQGIPEKLTKDLAISEEAETNVMPSEKAKMDPFVPEEAVKDQVSSE